MHKGTYKVNTAKTLVKFQDCIALRGGHWGILNTAIPQESSANTAIPQKNRKIPQSFNIEWKRDVILKRLLCMLKFRANKTEITTKNLLMNVRSGNFWCRQYQ